MKRLLLLLVAPCVMFSTLSAQITQKEADEIVQQRLDGETQPYAVYAKEAVQTEGFTVITATGETLALEYPCWVYYVDYAGEANGKYMIVKESSGNLLEVKTKKDTGPEDLAEWRLVTFEIEYPIEIPFEEYSLEGTSCQWINLSYPINDGELIIINSDEELKNYISCTEGSYPEIDFSQYTLLLASGSASQSICNIYKNLRQFPLNKYELNIEILLTIHQIDEEWIVALIVEKLNEESQIELDVTYEEFSLSGTLCLWTNLNHPFYPELIRINSNGELEQYISCAEGSYPEIDFSRYTLLLVKGRGHIPVVNIGKFFSQLSTEEYKLDIELLLYNHPSGAIAESWHTAIITNKLSEDCNIVLNVTQTITSCQLKNLSYPINDGEIIIINSEEELENYVGCTDIVDYPEIDFSQHTLLLVNGMGYYIVEEITVTDFQQLSSDYKLDITVQLGHYTMLEKWISSFIVKKLNVESNVELNVTYKNAF